MQAASSNAAGESGGLTDRVLLLLLNGMSPQAAEAFCHNRGQSPDAARQIVAEARKRITLAAEFSRDEQLGKAVSRLEDLYAKSVVAQDIRTALQAQRELNRLLSLYSRPLQEDCPRDEGAAQRLELIERYILPLHLTDASYPIEEHVRIAADILRAREGTEGE